MVLIERKLEFQNKKDYQQFNFNIKPMNAGTDKDNRYTLRNHSSFRKTGLQGKIILHRIISVVCLTSFLSETWNRNPAMMMNYLTGPEREDDRWQACLSLMIA